MSEHHRERGWFIPFCLEAHEIEGHKRRVLTYGRADGCESLRWRHDGTVYRAIVGEPLIFAGVDEGHVIAILDGGAMRRVITTGRGFGVMEGDPGPILVGREAIQ